MVSEPISNQAPISAARDWNAGIAGWPSSPWARATNLSRFGSDEGGFSGVRMESAPALRGSRTSREVVSTFGPISRPEFSWIQATVKDLLMVPPIEGGVFQL